MKAIGFSVLIGIVLGGVSPVALSQQARDQIEAGIGASGLPKGQVRPMTVEIAKQLVAVAKKASCSPPAGSCTGAFAVSDDAGVLIYLEIIDGVLAGAPGLATKKAKTSALWRRPTTVFLEAVTKGTNTSYADGTFPEMTTSPGGMPLIKDGRIVGGLGIAAVGHATPQILGAVAEEATKILGKQ